MAITHNGTVNSLPQSQIPSGYTRPTVTTFTDVQYERTMSIEVDKTTVDEADADTTMTAIFNNGTIGIVKQVADELALDFLGTATVTAYSELIALSTNKTDYLTNTASKYLCTVKIYVKVA